MFDPEDFVEESVKAIKDQIEGKAIIACSGGVDSVVASVLASRALGEDLLAVFIDTGFMRKGEAKTVDELLNRMQVNHRIIDASETYFVRLKGITDGGITPCPGLEEKKAILRNGMESPTTRHWWQFWKND